MKKPVALVLSVTLALTLVIGAYALAERENPIRNALALDVGRIKMGIDVVGYNHTDGSITGEYHNDDDVMTSNFVSYLCQMFENCGTNDGPTNFQFNWTSGTKSALALRERYFDYAFTASWTQTQTNSGGTYVGSTVGIGNSSTATALSDNKLLSQDGDYVQPRNTTYANGNVTIVAVCVVNGSQTTGITEAGLFLNGGASRTALMFRETFTAIPCVIGDTIVITYTIQLADTGFTDNFGKLLESIFLWTWQGNAYVDWRNMTQPMTTIDGSVHDCTAYAGNYYYGGSYPAQNIFWRSIGFNDTFPCAGYMLGTDGTAFDRSQHNLSAPLDTNATILTLIPSILPIVTSNATAKTSNITLTHTVNYASSYTFREVGFFILGFDFEGDYNCYMLWRLTFDPFAYAAEQFLEVTFRIVG